MASDLDGRSERRGARLGRWLALLVLPALAFALHLPARANPYLIDDREILEKQEDVTRTAGWWQLFAHDYWHGVNRSDRNLYRPLTILSFHLNARLTGVSPAPVRLTNVALLGALAVLFVLWLTSWGVPLALGWTAGVLLVAHPLECAVIDYVVGRADLQVLVGVVGFLACQRRAQLRSRWSVGNGLAALGLAALALGSKESGAIVLPLALLQDWCATAPGRQWLTSLALVLLPLLIFATARFLVVGAGHDYGEGYGDDPLKNPLIESSLAERIPASLSIAEFYGRQLLWPDPSFWFVPDRLPDWTERGPWVGLVLVLGLCALFLWGVARRAPLAVALGFALGQFAIIGQLAKPLAFYAANRLAGPFLVGGLAATALALGERVRRAAALRVLVPVLGLLLLVPMVREVRWVNERWSSLEGMASIDLELHPAELDSLTGYASAMLEAEHWGEAARYGALAVERRPGFPGNWFVLATAQLALGQRDEARQSFGRTIELSRDVPHAKSYLARSLINLAGLELQTGDREAGRRSLLEAEALRPTDPRVLFNLALLAEIDGDTRERIRRYQQIAQLHPVEGAEFVRKLADLERILRLQGSAHLRDGEFEQAIENFDRVLEIRPGDAEVLRERTQAVAGLSRRGG